MFKTQLLRTDEAPDLARANRTGITGDATEYYIRGAVQWTLTEEWENEEIDLVFGSTFRVAVWRDDVFLGVYTMDAEERCPEWRNLTKVAE
jgi:hypothetical protein